MAYFDDTETSSGNTVQAGTIDLTYQNDGAFSWTVSDVRPGQGQCGNAVESIATTLKNAGSLEADHIEIDLNNTTTEDDSPSSPQADTDPDSAKGMAKYIKVSSLRYGPSGNTQQYVDCGSPTDFQDSDDGVSKGIKDLNGNGYVDLDDLDRLSGSGALDDFEPPGTGADGPDMDFNLRLIVHEGMDSDYQGDSVQTEVVVSLHQNPSQDNDID